MTDDLRHVDHLKLRTAVYEYLAATDDQLVARAYVAHLEADLPWYVAWPRLDDARLSVAEADVKVRVAYLTLREAFSMAPAIGTPAMVHDATIEALVEVLNGSPTG